MASQKDKSLMFVQQLNFQRRKKLMEEQTRGFFLKKAKSHLCITWTSLAKLLCLEPNELQTLLTERIMQVTERNKTD